MNRSIHVFGGLRCRAVHDLPEGAAPKLLVVLCHGFGAPGSDLVDLGGYLLEGSETLQQSCCFVFPEAPIDLGPLGMPGGRAWWPINMARLAEINETQDYDQLTKLTPDGMLDASEQLAAAVKDAQLHFDVQDAETVLGGFSQGAMVSLDVVLRHQLNPAYLVLFSGTLLCRDDWREMAGRHPGCPVYQTHGTIDPILPFEPSVMLHEMLKEQGFDAQFVQFNGQHTIPMPQLIAVGNLLEQMAAES